MMNISVGSSRNSMTIPDNQICDLDGEISDQVEKLPLYFDSESDDKRELIIDEDISENIDSLIGNETKSKIPIEHKICDFGNMTDFFITEEESSAFMAKSGKRKLDISEKNVKNASSRNRNGVIINEENIICNNINLNEENNYCSLNSNSDYLKLTIDNSINKGLTQNSVNDDFQHNVKDQISNSDSSSESPIPKGIVSNASEKFFIRKNIVDIENTSNISPEINQISIAEKNESFKKNIIPEMAEIPEAQIN
ncbi:hypothetical protein TNCV_3765661 [Trichonephila clavipes]|nr:hypothetical protein TNCV_3765661 [Trichonephila clavipes]